MSSVWYVLLLLLPFVGVAYVVWVYRKTAAEKEAASRERMAALIVPGPAAAGGTAQAAPKGQAASGASAKPAAVAPPPSARHEGLPRHERLLSRPETLMYYMLKAGLADHEVFPKVSLDAVVETPENPFPQQPGERQPAQHEFDFVICDKNMRVVAVVQLHGPTAGPWADLVYRRLNAVGVKMLRVDPGALPRREQVRSLIFG